MKMQNEIHIMKCLDGPMQEVLPRDDQWYTVTAQVRRAPDGYVVFGSVELKKINTDPLKGIEDIPLNHFI